MKFFALFIYRPVATILLSVAITLCGVLGFRLLPVAPLPQVDFPVIMVSASLPGASPETMASSVATPLERSLGRIAGVNEMTSSSSLGSTRIILLIGIVKKNAIMMIDFALAAEREQGMSPRDAIFQACLLRFRPILMTTLAALLGALPLMLSTGVGAELRRPLGIGMVGGLLVSQVLTLFTTPVIYLLFDQLALWTKSRFPKREEEA